MTDMKIRQGARLTFEVQRADDSAISATFIMKKQDDTVTVDQTVEYDSEGVAVFELNSPDTDTIGS